MVARVLLALAAIYGLSGLAGLCPSARADDTPWATGVSDADQKAAFALYAEGNGFFEHDRYKEALDKYDAALKLWDHPAIRYNAAVCLINLERWLDAYDYLTAALRYGEAPLGHDIYRQAQMQMTSVSKEVAELQIKCDEPGATVRLDGEVLYTAPSTATRRVLTREPHQIVAEKPGYQTETRAIRLEPGKPTVLVLEMRPLPSTSHRELVRRWDRWKPWAVTAAGAAVALVGTGFALAASSDFSKYDKQASDNFTAWQGTDMSKPPVPPDASLHSSGARDADLAYGAFAVGGAVVVAGFAMVLMNQPHLGPVIAPSIGREHAGAVISVSW